MIANEVTYMLVFCFSIMRINISILEAPAYDLCDNNPDKNGQFFGIYFPEISDIYGSLPMNYSALCTQ